MAPDADRQAKPFPWTLVVLAAGTTLACLIILATAECYFVRIPAMRVEITNRSMEIASLRQRAVPTMEIIAQIEALKERLVLLDALDDARVRYGRVLDRICNAVNAQDGVWLRSLTIQSAVSPPPPGASPGAKRYTMTVHGSARGTNAEEQDERLNGFLALLSAEYKVGSAPSSVLRAIFKNPVLFHRKVSGPVLEFSLRMNFELDRQQSLQPLAVRPFTFEPGERRDPFVPQLFPPEKLRRGGAGRGEEEQRP